MSLANPKSDLTSKQTFMMVNVFECLFSVTTCIIQYSTRHLGVTITEIAFARCLCNFIIAYLILQQKQVGLFEGVTRDMVLPLVLRCALGNLGFLAVTYTFKYLPLSVGTVIIATSPFAVAVLCSIFLKERVFRSDLIAIFVSFTGMAVMAYAKQGSSTGLTQ